MVFVPEPILPILSVRRMEVADAVKPMPIVKLQTHRVVLQLVLVLVNMVPQLVGIAWRMENVRLVQPMPIVVPKMVVKHQTKVLV